MAEKSGYKNEVDKPSPPRQGTESNVWGCDDYKKQSQDISYGQAGKAGCSSDDKKVRSQFKDYHWTD